MEIELHLCPHCGGEIEGMALSYNEKNKALHFEMDHGDLACHLDLEFSPVFLNMQLDDLFGIFQRIQRSSGWPPKMQAPIRIARNRGDETT